MPGDEIVDVYISRIMQKLRQTEGGDDLIQNFRGGGWSLRTPTKRPEDGFPCPGAAPS
jgi:DNA-binding response OmpR family regulator